MTAPRINCHLTLERLLEVLHYDPLTGVWHWLVCLGNGKPHAGSIAGTIDRPNNPVYGYRNIEVDGHKYKSSRLAVFYMTGEWPPHLVDHENGKHADDRWENLRPATRAQNQHNRKLDSTNTSGFKDVWFEKRRNKWRAYIKCNGESYHLGYHTTREDAAIAVAEASERLHGDFAHKEALLPHRRLLAAKREREFNEWCARLAASRDIQPGGVCMFDEQESQNQTQEVACATDQAASSSWEARLGDNTFHLPERALGNAGENTASQGTIP
jgi:hypothetical protein